MIYYLFKWMNIPFSKKNLHIGRYIVFLGSSSAHHIYGNAGKNRQEYNAKSSLTSRQMVKNLKKLKK